MNFIYSILLALLLVSNTIYSKNNGKYKYNIQVNF